MKLKTVGGDAVFSTSSLTIVFESTSMTMSELSRVIKAMLPSTPETARLRKYSVMTEEETLTPGHILSRYTVTLAEFPNSSS